MTTAPLSITEGVRVAHKNTLGEAVATHDRRVA